MKEEALLICCQLPAEAELSRILPKFHMLTGRVILLAADGSGIPTVCAPLMHLC
jgi:hypothetical protein